MDNAVLIASTAVETAAQQATHKAFATADAHCHQLIRIAVIRWWTSAKTAHRD